MRITITAGRSFSDHSAYLLVIDDGGSRRVPLPVSGSLTVGRADDTEIPVEDASASRRHAQFEVAGDSLSVADLGSHNGTRVNGELISGSHRVISGDIIEIGSTCLVPHIRPARMFAPDTESRDVILGRLRTEVARVRRHRRRLAIAVAQVRDGDGPTQPPELLLAGESMGYVASGSLLFVLPELGTQEAQRRGAEIQSALAVSAPTVRVAVACYPSDGADAGSLLSVARTKLDGVDEHVAVGDYKVVAADAGTARTYDLLRRLAASDLAVLVAGETGAGKEMAAFALHTWSSRHGGPFVAVNCAALPPNLIESELFGHEKGAFSGADASKAGIVERAEGGTLFLDEVGEMPAAAQAKLLRVLQEKKVQRVGSTKERPVDFRLVAATNRDVLAEVEAGRFREDLYYRLAAAVVEIPPLRDRPRDVAVLARDSLARACEALGREPMHISDEAMRALRAYQFPGNVRELINAMEFAAATNPGDVLDPTHLPASMNRASRDGAASQTSGDFRSLADEVAELEARRIAEAMEATGGNQKAAAELIGMPRRTFVTKLGRYKLR